MLLDGGQGRPRCRRRPSLPARWRGSSRDAAGAAASSRARVGGGLGLGRLVLDLQRARERGVRHGQTLVAGDGAAEGLLGAVVGGERQVDAGDVGVARLGRGRAEREPVAICSMAQGSFSFARLSHARAAASITPAPPPAAAQDVFAAAAAARSDAEAAAQQHLLHEEGAGRCIPAALHSRDVDRAEARAWCAYWMRLSAGDVADERVRRAPSPARGDRKRPLLPCCLRTFPALVSDFLAGAFLRGEKRCV